MAINFRSNTIIKNLRVGPLSGGGNGGGGGGSSEPSYLIGGAPFDSNGSAYVYDATNYTSAPTKLQATDGGGSDWYGWSNAVSGNYIAIGAPANNSTLGAVYVYDATNLSSAPTKLVPSDGVSNERFGFSVFADGDYLVVGCQKDNQVGYEAGAVYVYSLSNLSASPTKLTATSANDLFGTSVKIAGNTLMVGAVQEGSGYAVGRVYLYDLTNLSASPTIIAPPTTGIGVSSLNFGSDIGATDDYIVVGAKGYTPSSDTASTAVGSVFVYDRSNLGNSPTMITAPTPGGRYAHFGESLSISGDNLFIGSTNRDDGLTSQGAVFVYDITSLGTSPTKLQPSDAHQFQAFGIDIFAYGSTLAVGAKGDNSYGDNTGAVYVYDIDNLSSAPTKLLPSTVSGNQNLGYSVSLG